jgi:hypothetical protein
MSVFVKTMIALTAFNVSCIGFNVWKDYRDSEPNEGPVKFRSMPTMTEYEKAQPIMLTTIGETKIILRFVSHTEWQKYDSGLSEKLQKTHMLAGFAKIWRDPCEIYLPADTHDIISVPDRGQAHFDSLTFASTLAHEILHCLKGRWHPDWNEIYGGIK